MTADVKDKKLVRDVITDVYNSAFELVDQAAQIRLDDALSNIAEIRTVSTNSDVQMVCIKVRADAIEAHRTTLCAVADARLAIKGPMVSRFLGTAEVKRVADVAESDGESSTLPWNWCSRCKQMVDADDIVDGSEVQCHGCDRTYVCVAMTNGSWALDDVT